MTESTKIAIQLGQLSLSAEGSESFVRDAIELWDKLADAAPAPLPAPPPAAASRSPDGAPAANELSKYENVFDEVDGRLKIIANIPGSNKAEKSRNVALALLYGHYSKGVEQIPADDVRAACTDQGCYDATNFAQYLRGLKEKVAMNTKKGGGYEIKLTAPGRKAAKELVEALNSASS